MGILLNIAFSVAVFCALTYFMKGEEELKEGVFIACLVGLFGLVISAVFLSIFGDAVTALLMCFGIDLELHGYPAKYGPPNFHERL